MSNVWQIGQEKNAATFYDNMKKMIFIGSELYAIGALTGMCNTMNSEFDEITNDENNYLIELDSIENDISAAKNELAQKIAELKAQIDKLEKKYDNGTITDKELEELKQKKQELNILVSDGNSYIDSMNSDAKTKGQEVIKTHESKIKVAEDYGNVTLEKGTPLAETKVKGGFFRKLFGTTGKDKKKAGEKAVEAGNNLLDKVNVSKDLEKNIKTRTK